MTKYLNAISLKRPKMSENLGSQTVPESKFYSLEVFNFLMISARCVWVLILHQTSTVQSEIECSFFICLLKESKTEFSANDKRGRGWDHAKSKKYGFMQKNSEGKGQRQGSLQDLQKLNNWTWLVTVKYMICIVSFELNVFGCLKTSVKKLKNGCKTDWCMQSVNMHRMPLLSQVPW